MTIHKNSSSITVRAIPAWLVLIALLALLTGLAYRSAQADNAGFALAFDGQDDHVSLENTSSVFGGTDWATQKTLSLWIRPSTSQAPSSTPPGGEILLGNDRPHTFGITRAVFNGLDRIWVWNVDTNGLDAVGVDYQPDEWIQIALVHDGSELQAYLNGELVGQVTSGPTYLPDPSAAGTLYIGGDARGTTSRSFEGDIDEVRMWQAALDAGQIQSWMNQELTSGHPAFADLAAYYQMSDGSGTQVTDDSGAGNTGNLTGSMGDTNWVLSGAFGEPLATHTPTETVPPPSATATLMPTSLPTSAPTATEIPPTETASPPTHTSTPLPTDAVTPTPSSSPMPPTATATPLPATATATPTPTSTDVLPTATTIPDTPTTSPTPTSTAGSGGAGFALDFDGTTDFVEITSANTIFGPGWEDTKTVSLWVKPDTQVGPCAVNTPAWCDAIFGDRPRWWGISIGGIVGMDRIWIWNYDGSSSSPLDMIPIDYTPGEWVHVALVHSNGMLRAFENGIEVGALPSGATLQPNTGAEPILHLGGVINNSSRVWTFDGQTDELRLWSIARTESELSLEKNAPLTTLDPDLVAYYRMSDGSGSLLSDDSLHGHSGTLYDGARGLAGNGTTATWVQSTAPLGGLAPTALPTFTSTPTSVVTGTPIDTATSMVTPSDTPQVATSTSTSQPPTPTSTASPQPNTSTPTAASTPTYGPSPTPPSGLVEIAWYNLPGSSYDLDLSGTHLYVADTSGGLRILDISDPLQGTEIGHFETGTRAYGVATSGTETYVAATSSGVYAIDTTSPGNPTLLSNFGSGGFAWDLELLGDLLFVCDRLDGLHIVDVSDPSS
ncbi:MAG: LamG-like jellyroll fold domain-containing protein, partial [Anaerolineales bacterium]